MKLIALNWVGIGCAVAMIVTACVVKNKIPWWVLLIWLGILIVSKVHNLELLGGL